MISRAGSNSWRIYIFLFFVLLSAGFVLYRVFSLSIINHADYFKRAQAQYNSSSVSLAGRGTVYMADNLSGNKKPVATNRSEIYAYTNAALADTADDVAARVSVILGQDTVALRDLLEANKQKTYYVIANNITKEQGQKISDLKIKNISIGSKINRYYSEGYTASQVIGFLGSDGHQRTGQYGVEGYYDDVLSGKNSSGEGSDIVLTIDSNIEEMAEQKLQSVMQKWQSNSGSIIIEDPQSGAILAMASSPSFDPNHYSDFDLNSYVNKNVQEVYEPGSTFKSVGMAGALDKGIVTPETTYTDTGEAKVADRIIKNYDNKAHGLQTMRGVLEHSLNTGMIFVENLLGDDNFLNNVVAFGFGQKMGIDLSGEVGGNISNLYTGRKVNFATAAFGQGIAVTPLQLVNAYSAIANGGKLLKPYIVKEIIHPDGTSVITKPVVLGNPISEKTSATMRSMLVDVVNKGFDKARVAGYDVAGKTGTAQIPDSHGGYLGSDQFIHNFVGFAPASAPRFVILVKIDRPRGITFASDSLSPIFAEITRFMLRYYTIPPTN